MPEKPYAAWLPMLPETVPDTCRTPADTAAFELKQAGLVCRLTEDASLGDGYELKEENGALGLTGGKTGLLYGAYRAIFAKAAGEPLPAGLQKPFYPLRMLNCWDNADGSVERGYAGRSLWFEGGRMVWDDARIRQLARMLASAGLNVLCINNVNVKNEASQLIEDLLPDAARFAGILRPFGIRLMLSIDFSRPMSHGIPTADPLDERVQRWWAERAAAVYAAIPDFAGFLVKADSEHRPGPFTYGRTHAEGANMLARALKPHGGVLVWRAFVYNCQQDWRDTKTDRPMAAYETYKPLDGQFDDNVILQVKYGPFDFQVREPVSPALLGLEHTSLALEVQLAQEYTGQQIDLFAMNPLWAELGETLPPERVCAVAAVSNLGRDANYTGHPFAAVNLFGYGRYAWDPAVRPEAVIRQWARLTYGLPREQEDALTAMLLHSRAVYEHYTAPLGLCWMVEPSSHYGPNPYGYEFSAWGTFNRADREAVGIDRTANGTGYVLQYAPELCAKYADPGTCPDELLLFFHRLPYTWRMRDGRTLIQRIYDDHFLGYEETKAMAETLRTLDLPEQDRQEAAARMERQLKNAREWCDIVNTFFRRLSGIEDERGRKIYL